MSSVSIISMDAKSSSTMYPRQCTKTSYGFWFPCLFLLIIMLASLAQVCLWEVRVGLRRSQACEGPSRWVPPRITVFARCHRELCKHLKTDPFSLGRVFLYKMVTLKSFSSYHLINLLFVFILLWSCYILFIQIYLVKLVRGSLTAADSCMKSQWFCIERWNVETVWISPGICCTCNLSFLKDQGGFFIGTSPEWQLAVGTVAYFETSTPGHLAWSPFFDKTQWHPSSFYADWRSVADVSLNVNRVAGFWQFQNLTDIMCGKGSITNDQQWSICHSQQTSANYELTLWKVGQWYYAGQPSRLQKGTAWLMPQTVQPRSKFSFESSRSNFNESKHGTFLCSSTFLQYPSVRIKAFLLRTLRYDPMTQTTQRFPFLLPFASR